MGIIQIHSTIGEDGVLSLRIPIGPQGANREVIVTVRALDGDEEERTRDWNQVIESTYGSCAGLGVERAPQGELEVREQVE